MQLLLRSEAVAASPRSSICLSGKQYLLQPEVRLRVVRRSIGVEDMEDVRGKIQTFILFSSLK